MFFFLKFRMGIPNVIQLSDMDLESYLRLWPSVSSLWSPTSTAGHVQQLNGVAINKSNRALMPRNRAPGASGRRMIAKRSASKKRYGT